MTEQVTRKLLQAKHIPDGLVISLIREVSKPETCGATIWDVADRLPSFPEKVVRAKLSSMIKRGVIDGCTCGCRGDFNVLESNAS